MKWSVYAGMLAADAACGAPAAAQLGGTQTLRLATPALRIAGASLTALLRRADVQNGLKLGIRQRNELSDILAQPSQMRVAVTLSGSDANDPGSAQRQADEQIRAQLGDHDARIKAVLTAEQWDRLQQLSLQWRGPLAMAEPEVAQQVRLSAEHRSEVARIAAEYAAVKSEVMASIAQKQEDASPDGSRRMVAIRLDTSELDKRFSPARQKLEKAKQDAERTILAALDPDERARWKAACGATFTFRSDIKGLRF